MNRYLIRVDETLIKSFIRIFKSANRIYGCSLESETSDKVKKSMNDPYGEIVANMDIDELNAVLLDTFPHVMSGMIDHDSIKKVGVKLSEVVSDYAALKEQSFQISKIDFTPIFLAEFINSNLFKGSINIAYKITEKEFDQVVNEVNKLESRFSDIEELEDVLNEYIENPKAFRKK